MNTCWLITTNCARETSRETHAICRWVPVNPSKQHRVYKILSNKVNFKLSRQIKTRDSSVILWTEKNLDHELSIYNPQAILIKIYLVYTEFWGVLTFDALKKLEELTLKVCLQPWQKHPDFVPKKTYQDFFSISLQNWLLCSSGVTLLFRYSEIIAVSRSQSSRTFLPNQRNTIHVGLAGFFWIQKQRWNQNVKFIVASGHLCCFDLFLGRARCNRAETCTCYHAGPDPPDPRPSTPHPVSRHDLTVWTLSHGTLVATADSLWGFLAEAIILIRLPANW